MTEASENSFAALLSKIRHDLRTPVGHVIGYSEMIEEELEDAGKHDSAHDLQAIQNAGQRILALIDDHFSAGKTSTDQISDPRAAQPYIRIRGNVAGRFCG
jgi:K+-sensing histidine kinase KdpD